MDEGERLRELESGDGDAYLMATIHEAMRARPVLPNAEPRLTMEEVTIGDWTYPKGVVLAVNAYLVHHDPAIDPDPYAFRPERFLDESPGTYTWLPFGGGIRRCLGAALAMAEQRVVLEAMARRLDLEAPDPEPEHAVHRNVTMIPSGGARVVVTGAPRRTGIAK